MASAAPHASARTAADLIDTFCDLLWLQDGLAPASLASYRRDLTQFAAWLEARGTALTGAGRGDVEAFLADQYRGTAKATSIARRLSSLRRFFGLLLQQGTIDADPTLRIRSPKLPRRLPKNLTEAQVETLLADPDVYRDAERARVTRTRFAALEQELAAAYERWEALEARASA